MTRPLTGQRKDRPPCWLSTVCCCGSSAGFDAAVAISVAGWSTSLSSLISAAALLFMALGVGVGCRLATDGIVPEPFLGMRSIWPWRRAALLERPFALAIVKGCTP